MAKKPKFNLDAVRNITIGEQAQQRKAHNQTLAQPGDFLTAQVPDNGQLDRRTKKSAVAAKLTREDELLGKPRPGQVYTAKEGPDKERIDIENTRKFIRLAIERFNLAAEVENELRKEASDDVEFRKGNQWPDDIKTSRSLDNRPCLTLNRLPQFIRQITNEQRQQRPAIQVNPVGDNADTDTAEIFQGIIRHIEVQSDAEIAYDTAFDQMVTCGFGFFEVGTKFVDPSDPNNWDQELTITPIKNQFTVYFDPSAVLPDRSDAKWCVKIEDIPTPEYRVQYPDSELASLTELQSVGDEAADWVTKDSIRVAEYWHVEETMSRLAQVSTFDPETKQKGTKIVPADQVQDGEEVINTRPVVNRKVMWSKINAAEILEERETPGKYIRIIPVYGDDIEVNGKKHIAGMVRYAKDPQRMYNYWVSAGTEMIALAPKAPFVGAEGQFKNHEGQWAQANVRNMAFLEYKPVAVGQQVVGPPTRNVYEPPVQAINLMTKQADNDLKATTGIYDASLGEKGPDQSGKAILARQKQTDVATLNFSDNLARSIRHTGRVLIDLIPHIYDAPRVQRIINPDQTMDKVIVHSGQPDAAQGLLSDKIQKVYDLSQGTYDITVSVGPSYQSKRQEAVASQMALVQAYPNAFPIIGDMLVANMDWPQAKEMSERLKKMLPPQLQDDDETDPEVKVQKLQSQLAQIMPQHEALVQEVHKLTQIINEKQVEAKGQLEITRENNLAKVTVAEVTTKAQNEQTRMKMEFEQFKLLHMSAHEVGMQATDQSHEADMATQAQENQPEEATQ